MSDGRKSPTEAREKNEEDTRIVALSSPLFEHWKRSSKYTTYQFLHNTEACLHITLLTAIVFTLQVCWEISAQIATTADRRDGKTVRLKLQGPATCLTFWCSCRPKYSRKNRLPQRYFWNFLDAPDEALFLDR